MKLCCQDARDQTGSAHFIEYEKKRGNNGNQMRISAIIFDQIEKFMLDFGIILQTPASFTRRYIGNDEIGE
ncbi:MAG: hypothetical protein GF398_03855 [Chitinivibrionales bacterium]|nr:hypothetical protein [Chitinivibrionales bacterium]